MATWQQKSKLKTFHVIYEAFKDDPEKSPLNYKLTPRTWRELVAKTARSTSTLSHNLRELMKEDYIIVKCVLDKNERLQTIYEWNGERDPPVFEFKDRGKLKFAIKHCKDGKAYAGWGYWINPRQPGMKRYFRFVKGKREI